jgi:LPS sulfotransferase NodH
MTGTADRAGVRGGLLARARLAWSLRGARGRGADGKLVWMLGSPRTGSTWLLNLLAAAHPSVAKSDEPGIGFHLGLFAADVMGAHPATFEEARLLLPEARANDPNYFFSEAYRDVWQPRLRQLILERIEAQLQQGRTGKIKDPFVIIKEPTGSQVAPFIFTVLPSSKLLFLMRDPRDVLDSAVDAVKAGSWLAEQYRVSGTLSARERMDFLRGQAHTWLARTDAVERAYRGLPAEQRHRVRYEDLRANTFESVRDILRWLELDVAETHLRDVVEKLSFEALPESARGKGKFARAATPGAWRENLTSDEQALIHEILGDALNRQGYDAIEPPDKRHA